MAAERPLPGWPRGLREDLAAEYVGLSVSLFRLEEGRGLIRATWLTKGRKVYLRDVLDAYLDRKDGREDRAVDRGGDAEALAAAEWDVAFGGSGAHQVP